MRYISRNTIGRKTYTGCPPYVAIENSHVPRPTCELRHRNVALTQKMRQASNTICCQNYKYQSRKKPRCLSESMRTHSWHLIIYSSLQWVSQHNTHSIASLNVVIAQHRNCDLLIPETAICEESKPLNHVQVVVFCSTVEGNLYCGSRPRTLRREFVLRIPPAHARNSKGIYIVDRNFYCGSCLRNHRGLGDHTINSPA